MEVWTPSGTVWMEKRRVAAGGERQDLWQRFTLQRGLSLGLIRVGCFGGGWLWTRWGRTLEAEYAALEGAGELQAGQTHLSFP